MNLARMGVSTFAVGLGAVLTACLPPLVVPIAREDAGADTSAPSDALAAPDAMAPPPDAMAPPPDAMAPPPDGAAVPSGAGGVDLLVVIDDSNSMRAAQQAFQYQLGRMVLSIATTPGVTDVRVGVVSTDLGTPGSTVPSCLESDLGDDGRLNPRAFGPASQRRALPPVTFPAFCDDAVARQPFVTVSRGGDAMQAAGRATCHLDLGVGGCGMEQPLEAAHRALLAAAGTLGPNAGFLRPEATLAILVLTDEEDGSVRDCRFHDGVGACSDATDVFDGASTRWSSPDLNLRLYTYAPGGAQDPTWPVERYVDPSRPARGLLGLKPGHPERVVFGAITGAPLAIPRTADGLTDWDALLGPPAPERPDDFSARDASLAYRDRMAAGGEVSMRQADLDPACPNRLVPACRAPMSDPVANVCDITMQPIAWRARRIAEVARRFDASTLCAGAPCRNGMVASICTPGDTAPFVQFAAMVSRRAAR